MVESRQFRPNIVVVRSCNEEEEGNTEEEEVTNPEDSWEKIIIEGKLGDAVELKKQWVSVLVAKWLMLIQAVV